MSGYVIARRNDEAIHTYGSNCFFDDMWIASLRSQ